MSLSGGIRKGLPFTSDSSEKRKAQKTRIITDQARNTREGNVFSRVSPFTVCVYLFHDPLRQARRKGQPGRTGQEEGPILLAGRIT